MTGPTPLAPTGRALLLWLWRGYLARHKGAILLALLLMAAEGASLGLLAALMEPMFDRVFVEGEEGAIWAVGGAVAGVFCVRAVASTGHKVLMTRTNERSAARLRQDLVEHLMALDGSFHRDHPPGVLIERLGGDVAAVGQAWTLLVAGLGRDLVSLAALMAVAVGVDWRWTLVALVGVPLLILPSLLVQAYVRARSWRAREVAARMAVRLDEVFHGLAAIKLNGLEAFQARRYAHLSRRRVRAETQNAAGRALIPALVDVASGIGFLGVVYVGGREIADGTKTVGEFMAFFTAMGLAFEPIRRLGNLSGLWSAAAAPAERVRDVLEARPRLLSPARPLVPPAGPPRVELRDVRLSYEGLPALDGLSFVAEAGRTTALVGASGAGKSTVFNVLTRLVDPDAGEALVGGVPVRAMDLGALRGLFSVVSQDALLFDESIRDNVLLGREGVPEARLREVLRAAHVADFADALPQGLDSPAGPRGSLLSGGQRQRVAIARALLRDAPVLLLDEATSALDTRSEAIVQEALAALAHGRTTLVIAHRLSTVRGADKIVVLDRGRKADEGRHEELLARGGLYAELHRLQARQGDKAA